jgi:hypothetical protein
MRRGDDDYDDLYDDDDMLELKKLPNTGARAAQAMDGHFDEKEPISPLMFGPAGRGASPVVGIIPDHMLYKVAAQARRNEGFKDDRYLEKPKLEPFTEQQQKEAEDEKRLDEMLDRMYIETRKPVKSAARPMKFVKRPPQPPKKGGTRKRSTRRRVSRKRRNKRSRKGKSRNKRSRK